MRIISGIHKGRKISPPNNLPVRPTTDKAKEALFNILDNRYFFEEKNMLDLFSGTGNIGFEFMSRGGKEVIAVDNNINCLQFIKSTSEKFNFNIRTIQSDCLNFIDNSKEKFNFIFADPPYEYQEYMQLKDRIKKNRLLKKDGLLIIEHNNRIIFEDKNLETRKYGTVHFSLLSF